MPNLAFSPGPQQPPAPPAPISGGEKENASSGSKSLLADPVPRRCSSSTGGVGPGGRTPLESLSPDGEGVSAAAPLGSAATSSAGGAAVAATAAAVVCLRNSSCKCPDCDMSASVFGIDELRQVGSKPESDGGDGGDGGDDGDGGDGGDDGDGIGGDDGGGGVDSSPIPGADAPDKSGSVAMARTPPQSGSPTAATTTTVSPAEAVTVPPTPTPAAAVASPRDEPEPATASPAAAAGPPPATPGAASPAAAAGPPPVTPGVASPAAPAGPPPASPAVATPASRVAIATPGSVKEEVAATPTSAARSEGRRGSTEGGSRAGTPAAVTEVDSGSGKKKKGGGWGFRMARAVFSPGARLSPGKYLNVCGGGESQIVDGSEAGAGEDGGGKEGAAGGAGAGGVGAGGEEEVAAPTSSSSATLVDGLPSVPLSDDGSGGGGSGGMQRSSIGGKIEEETLLSDDDDEEEGPVGEGREEGAAGGEEEEAQVAAAGGTCRPPFTAAAAADGAAAGSGAATASGGFDVSGVSQGGGEGGKGVPRRVSRGGRRLSKDVFFECSSEAERVVASSDSENSDSGHHSDGDQSDSAATTATATTKTPTSAGTLSSAFPLSGGTVNSSETGASAAATPADVAAVASATAGGGGGGGGSSALASPPSLRLAARGPDPAAAAAVEAAVVAAAAAAAAAATATGGSALPTISADHLAALGGDAAAAPVALASEEGGGANIARGADAGQGEGQPDGGGRNAPALGRRRNRRGGARLELGMVDAYGHEDDMAKFSQSEVNAMIKERLAEEQGAFDKTLSSLKETHAVEMQVAAQELQRSSSDGNRAKIAARDAEALEREIAMLSERYGEAASEARSTGKALREKEALLDAVTNQLMGLKTDLANVRSEHNEEKQAIREAAEDERRLRCAAEGSLAQLEAAYNRLEDSEREKRAAGILKMKKDMQALAQAQFGEANKKFNAMKARLDAYEVETRRLKEAAQAKDAQIKEAGQHAEELRLQMASAQKQHADSAAEAARREHLLQDDLDALREESEARLDEMDAIARERDAANTGRDVSQDALARMAIRNTQMKESVADLEGKVKELEGFCTEALDELDQERANTAALTAALGTK